MPLPDGLSSGQKYFRGKKNSKGDAALCSYSRKSQERQSESETVDR